jgi:hypothetical protein
MSLDSAHVPAAVVRTRAIGSALGGIGWRRLLVATSPGLLLAVVAGAVVRIVPAVGAGFPLGDGGLFVQMALDLRSNGFIPPPTVTHYGAPWVYPPAGLYILALVPGDPIDTLRWLPILWSVALIAAVWLLACELVGKRIADLAALAYALLPWSYWWLIQGGGVTRALGALLAVLAIWATARRTWLPLGILLGLTVITHPEAAFFATTGIVVVWAVRWRSWRALLAVPVTLAIAGAWLVIILPPLGLDGLLRGLMSRPGAVSYDSVRKVLVLAELWPAALLGVLGVVLCLRHRTARWLVVWAVVCMVSPGAIGRWVAIPWSMLIGLAIEPIFALRLAPRWASVPATAVLAAAVAITVTVPVLPAADRARMAAIAQTVDPGITYAVYDSRLTREWFPLLARHHSTTTKVGFEWVGGITPTAGDRVYGIPEDSP